MTVGHRHDKIGIPSDRQQRGWGAQRGQLRVGSGQRRCTVRGAEPPLPSTHADDVGGDLEALPVAVAVVAQVRATGLQRGQQPGGDQARPPLHAHQHGAGGAEPGGCILHNAGVLAHVDDGAQRSGATSR